MYSPTLGRWMQPDPAGYVDGMNLYGALSGNPVGRRDPSGLMPCTCNCDGIKVDAKDQINRMFQDVIDRRARQGDTAAQLAGAIERAFAEGPMISAIERRLEKAIRDGTIDGVRCTTGVKVTPVRGNSYMYPSASAIRLCGRCVGTDKLSHFMQEGRAYYQFKQEKDEAYAIAWGYWTEGLTPPNLTPEIWTWLMEKPLLWGLNGDSSLGGTVLDPHGSASRADIAANESGLRFWEDIFGLEDVRHYRFDICKYVDDSWDHLKTPNEGGAKRLGPRPPRPATRPTA